MISSQALYSNRARVGTMADTDSLADVYALTLRSAVQPKTPFSPEAVYDALTTTCGMESVSGILINNRGFTLELSFTTEEAMYKVYDYPLQLPDQPLIHFELAYDDTFTVTFYNVPLGSAGTRERRMLTSAGATVLAETIITRRFKTAAIKTGERRYHCSGKSTFTFLPKTVRLYEGRILGCRYRGQARDLARQQPPTNLLPAVNVWGLPDIAFMQQPDPPRSRTSTVESEHSNDRPSTPTKEQSTTEESPAMASESTDGRAHFEDQVVIAPAPVATTVDAVDTSDLNIPLYVEVNAFDPLSAPTSPIRKPAKKGNLDQSQRCSHRCLDCSEEFPTTILLNNHQMADHPTHYATDYRNWQAFKAADIESYRRKKQLCLCSSCHGFIICQVRNLPP